MELTEVFYEKIETRIQEIEKLASDGVFSYPEKEAPKKCQQIILAAKKLRQALREALVIVPTVSNGEGDAA